MNFPLHLHFELIKHAFDTTQVAIFADLLSHAFKRCDFRRLEVPYISDIDFEVSSDIKVNVREGYELIGIDLNEAELKQEIMKLRNKKQELGEEDEENTAKTSEKQKPKPGQQKKGADFEQQTPDAGEVMTSTGLRLQEKELQKIDHQFTYMLIKRTANPANAIFNIRVEVADEHLGPNLPPSWKCIAIPINQYTGIRATYHTVPYLCFEQSQTMLSQESEKMSLLVDIKPIISKSPFIRPDYGYKKVDVDLRQVPKEFIKLGNIDYVYISYKNDTQFYNIERLAYIFDSINALENTLNKTKISNELDEAKALLNANFGYAEFQKLSNSLKNALEGPLGDKLLTDEYDLLAKVAFHVWKTYISPILVQVDHFYYLKLQKELLPAEVEQFEEKIINSHLKPSFIDLLQIFLKIVAANEYQQDILWITKMGLELGKMLEEKSRYTEASQTLRRVYDKICLYRDEKLQRRLKSELDLILPFSITCSNEKISSMIAGMKKQYFDWKLSLERMIRRTVGSADPSAESNPIRES